MVYKAKRPLAFCFSPLTFNLGKPFTFNLSLHLQIKDFKLIVPDKSTNMI
jgi:hypothetical protein